MKFLLLAFLLSGCVASHNVKKEGKFHLEGKVYQCKVVMDLEEE